MRNLFVATGDMPPGADSRGWRPADSATCVTRLHPARARAAR
jgi:hypothetical protein